MCLCLRTIGLIVEGSLYLFWKHLHAKVIQWPLHASPKIKKKLHVHRKSKQSRFALKYKSYSCCAKHIYKINTIISKIYWNILVAFYVLKVCISLICEKIVIRWPFLGYFLVYWLFFSFAMFPDVRCKSELVRTQTRVCGIWKDIYG